MKRTLNQRLFIAVALWTLLASVYMLTYSGRIELGDEMQYFDAVGNLSAHGAMYQDISMWQPGAEPTDFSVNRPNALRILNTEPGMMLAAVPLYRLAENTPALGLVHTVYLFNILVTPLIGVAFYILALALGYDDRVAVMGALCLGLLTALWPYSQTFFREPLMILWMVVGAIFLEKARKKVPGAEFLVPSGVLSTQYSVLSDTDETSKTEISTVNEGESSVIAESSTTKRFSLGTKHSALSTLYYALGTLFSFALAMVSKEAVVLALPGLLLMALPDFFWESRLVKRLALPVLIFILILTFLLAYTDLIQIIGRLLSDISFFGRFGLETGETQLILRIFAFSVGGSFWGTSPILLLSIPGAWLLWRRGQARIVFGALLVALGYCVGYALFRGETWHGGTVWPQRFLLPALPFALLPTLEVLSAKFLVPSGENKVLSESDKEQEITSDDESLSLGTKPSALGTRLAILLLILYSAWWQFSGVSYRWEMYATATFQESFGLIHWMPGYFDLRFLRPLALTQFWGREELNFAWVRMDLVWWPLAFGGVAVVSAWGLWRELRRGLKPPANENTKPTEEVVINAEGQNLTPSVGLFRLADRFNGRVRYAAFTLLPIFLLFTALSLLTIGRIDEIYLASRPDLFALVDEIRARTEPDDVVFISDPQSRLFYFNHGKFGPIWTPILNYHPGERGSCGQALEVESDNPAVLLNKETVPLITHFATHGEREHIWLVMESGPEVPCVIRPLERYLGQRYYRISETRASPLARLVEFSAADAPDPYAFRNPEHLTELRFTTDNGEAVDLVGYTLTAGTTYHPGDVLPLSLAWRVDETPKRDFTVAWFVADENGAVVAQGEDTWPGATFAPATLMTPGVLAWDHRALWLPDDLPTGEYRLWVRMYWYNPETGAPDNLIVSGGQTAGEDTIGVLDTPIRVTTDF